MSTVSRWTSPAVFLDRDGTIIEDVGYVRDPSQVVFFNNTVQALALLAAKFRLFILTNQSGVAEGALTHSEVDRVGRFLRSEVKNDVSAHCHQYRHIVNNPG